MEESRNVEVRSKVAKALERIRVRQALIQTREKAVGVGRPYTLKEVPGADGKLYDVTFDPR